MKTKSNTLAIFGGTFNPVHLGHLAMADAVKRECGYDTILMVPASIPAHKEADPYTDDRDRIAMLELAIKGIEYLKIENCEIDRGGISYMIDTVDYVNSHYTFSGKPGLIIGDDLIAGFNKWRCVRRLVEAVDLIVARRLTGERLNFEHRHVYLENLIVDAASREIRDMADRDECIDAFVPADVAAYIAEHSLYRRS